MSYRGILRKYGITQIELAERLGINRVSVSRLLADDNDMRLSTLRKIADAIGCSVGELVGDEMSPDTNGTALTCPKCGCKLSVNIDAIS